MKKHEKMIMDDAIQTAMKNDRKVVILNRICIVLGVVIVAMLISLAAGLMR